MVNASLVETILREQENPGCSTTRQIRNLYNERSGEDEIIQHSDEDKEFQAILLKVLRELPKNNEENDDDDDDGEPISYTVKLKDSDESSTPKLKRRSIIKLPKESKSQSESDEASSDSEKPPATASTIVSKPFSPLFLNNMKKFGVTSDWLAKRSNLIRQSAYSRSSVESNTSKLDAMIKSASAKPVLSNRKLSFVENSNTTPTKVDGEKENADPLTETNANNDDDIDPSAENNENSEKNNDSLTEANTNDDNDNDQLIETKANEDKANDPSAETSTNSDEHDDSLSETNKNDDKEEVQETMKLKHVPSTDELSNDIDKTEDDTASPVAKPFLLCIPRVNVLDKENVKVPKRSNSSSSLTSNDELKQVKVKPTRKRKPKKEKIANTAKKTVSPIKDQDEDINNDTTKNEDEDDKLTNNDDVKGAEQKKPKVDQSQARIEHLKKLLRISGIRVIMKKAELEQFQSNKAKINYLKSLFDKAGFTGSLSIKECEKFRKKRDTEKELLEIQANSVDVKGHVKGGRTLRGQCRDSNDVDISVKRKRRASSEVEDNEQDRNDHSSDSEKVVVKRRRIMKMEASPEVSEDE